MRLAQANSKGKTRNVEFDATRGNRVPAKSYPEGLLCLSFPEGICVCSYHQNYIWRRTALRLSTIPKPVHPSPQPVDLTPVPFRRPAFGDRSLRHHQLALLCRLLPPLLARFRLAIKRLRDRRRAAHLA